MLTVLQSFDSYLAKRSLRFSSVIIGGAALIVLGIVKRATKDVDCLFPEVPPEIKAASRQFAKEELDLALDEDWLNNGPMSLAADLPTGWQERLNDLFVGKSLILKTLSRSDLLCTKLFALCDRQEDLHDCIALAPTKQELTACLPWVLERDTNPLWPEHVQTTFAALSEELGHDE